jgi:hypothetical protein
MHVSYWNTMLKTTQFNPLKRAVLKTGNPEAVATYQTNMKEYYEQHHMVQRITRLIKTTTSMRPPLFKQFWKNGIAIRVAR